MRAALFDLDGVLVDTEGLYTEFWAEIGRRYGIPDPDFAINIKGNNLDRILSGYFLPETHSDIVARLDAFQSAMPYAFFDGAVRLIGEIRDAGWKCALVTSSDRRKMESLYLALPELREMMDAIVTGDMVKKSKPDPEGYLLGARLVGVEPRQCVVFEDSYAGLEAGRAAGAHVVALATTNAHTSLIGKADIVFDSIAGITVDKLQMLF